MSKDADFSNEMGPDFGFSDLPDEVNQDQEVSTETKMASKPAQRLPMPIATIAESAEALPLRSFSVACQSMARSRFSMM